MIDKEFDKSDEGLGTVYERVKLYDKLEWLIRTYKIRSVLEGPIDGITGIKGINSLIFAKNGIPATVVLPDNDQIDYAEKIAQTQVRGTNISYIKANSLSYVQGYYDLVWNFHAVSLVQNQQLLFSQMVDKSSKYILVLETNRLNYGFLIHRFYHLISQSCWSHGNCYWMRKAIIKRNLLNHGLKIVSEFFLDSPWWPDIDDLKKIPKLFRAESCVSSKIKPPYFNKDKEFERIMKRSSFIESCRFSSIKPIFSHIFGILAEKQ